MEQPEHIANSYFKTTMKNLSDIPTFWLSLELTGSTYQNYEECTAPALEAQLPLLWSHHGEGDETTPRPERQQDATLYAYK
jgi:hypothetical protein